MEVEKRNIFASWRDSKDHMPNSFEPVDLQVGGVNLRYCVAQPQNLETLNFIKTYYRNWVRPNLEKPEWTVYLHQVAPPHDSFQHPIWESQWPYHATFKEDDGGAVVLERDFAALVSDDRRSIHVWTPKIHEHTTDTLDNLLLYLLSERLYLKDSLLLHSCAVVKNGQAYVFYGTSGAGKSTLAAFSKEHEGLRIISEDKTLLIRRNGMLQASALPILPNRLFKYRDEFITEFQPVRALIHLVRTGFGIRIEKLNPAKCLPTFLRETLDLDPSRVDAQLLMNLVTAMIQTPKVFIGEMSYPKGVSFWPMLDRITGET
jgi:hypothetical protein